MEQTVAQIEVDLGPIDTLIYNAGNGVWKNSDETGRPTCRQIGLKIFLPVIFTTSKVPFLGSDWSD